MAKFISNQWADVRGSVNGTTYSRNRFASIMRNKTSPVNPNTGAQSLVRQNFGALSASFRALAAATIAAWNAATVNWQKTNVFGNQYQLTGQNLYVMLNQNLLQVGATEITTPPSPADMPIVVLGPNSLSLDISSSDIRFDVVSIDAGVTVPTGFAAQIYASPPVSAGRSFSSNLMRWIANTPAGTGVDLSYFTEYTARYGGISGKVGMKIFMGIKLTKIASGQTSSLVQTDGIIVT